MIESSDLDVEALDKLLDGLIAAPVERVMTGQLRALQAEMKQLGSDLVDLSDLWRAAGGRQQELDRMVKSTATTIDALAARTDALVELHGRWRGEWREAQATIVQDGMDRHEAMVLSLRRQTHRLALLAWGAGLLSAAAVEVIRLLL